ncbi:MAG: N-acetylmuramoyl-L-alanine amidase [Patescibacteria group bacterium]
MILRKTTKRVGGVFAILAVLWLCLASYQATASAPDRISAETIQQNTLGEQARSPFLIGTEYQSPDIMLSKAATVFGFTWHGTVTATFSVQYKNDTTWSDWKKVPAMEGVGKNDLSGTDLLFVSPTTTFRYRYTASEPLTNVQAFALRVDSRTGVVSWLQRFLQSFVPASHANTPIIPRADWGANEEISFWEPEYAQPEKIIVHHTAGADGSVNPETVIQSIQYWHAVALGWGDIGYNYLIDANGNIYEGRKGGDGVIGAHAYRNSACNEQRFGGDHVGVDFNRGTIGISLLGNYQDDEPTAAALDSLSRLIADKAHRYGISPIGFSNFQDLVHVPNVLGHKDVDCTLCPGTNVEDRLVSIRTLSQHYYDELGTPEATTRASFVAASDRDFNLQTQETITLWADFKNTGTSTWHRNDTVPLMLAVSHAGSPLADSSWLSDTAVAKLHTVSVAPGETGRFEFTITAPNDHLEVTETFQLVQDGLAIVNTDFQLVVHVTGLDWAARPKTQAVNAASFLGARLPTSLTFTNAGTQTWTRDNTYLYIYDLGDATSRYRDRDWSEPDGKILLKQTSVKPGQTGTFEFQETSPVNPGRYKQIFRLYAAGQRVVNSEVELITRVDTMYKARYVSSTLPLAMKTGWRPSITVRFKNTGVTTWDKNIRLNAYDLGFRASRFSDPDWSTATGGATLNETSVKPGAIGSFTLRLRAPQPGLYLNMFQLSAANYPYQIQGGAAANITRVDPAR